MSIPKDIRFKVFWRDGFTCQYCGRKPPEVVLEIDHIVPRSRGGTDNIENLITACRDCNRSKNKKLIAPALRLEELKEKSEQLQAFIEYTQQIEQSYRRMVQAVIDKWKSRFYYEDNESPEWNFTKSLHFFVRHLPLSEIFEAIDFTLLKSRGSEYQARKYFFGILWRKLRERRKGTSHGENRLDDSTTDECSMEPS